MRFKVYSCLKWLLVIHAAIYIYLGYGQYLYTTSESESDRSTAHTYIEEKNDVRMTKMDYHAFSEVQWEQSLRVQRLQHYCETFKPYATKPSPKKRVYISRKYNFTLCQVPKIGTTLLALVIGTIENATMYDLQAVSREDIQRKTFQFSLSLYSEEFKEQRTIVISRDPFSRLFSTYIDKSYLPGTYFFNKRMINRKLKKFPNSTRCIDLDFQDFLEFVIVKEHSRGMVLDRHVMPVTSTCRPCEYQPFLVLKQETFEKDIWYALKNVGVDENTLQMIDKLFTKWKDDLSVPALIKAINFEKDQECFSWTDTAKRIWNALKILGYIHTNEQFPIVKLKANNMIGNTDYFLAAVLETLKNRPLTSNERSEQRRQALVDAYMIVKPDTLKSIQEIYKQDFELFGYPLEPPS